MAGSRRQLIEDLFELMGGLFRQIKTGVKLPGHKTDLSRAEMHLLMFVAHHKQELTMKDVAEAFQITGGAVTQLVDRLVEKKLLNRIEDDVDRRTTRLALSKKGEQSFTACKRRFLTAFERPFAKLSDRELTQLTRILAKLDH